MASGGLNPRYLARADALRIARDRALAAARKAIEAEYTPLINAELLKAQEARP